MLRTPPAWGPEQEQTYPFRQWSRDVMLWSIATELEPARKAAAVMLNLRAAAREVSRQIPPQAIVDGGVINGIAVDPLTFLMHALQERFGNLGAEVRVQAVTRLGGTGTANNSAVLAQEEPWNSQGEMWGSLEDSVHDHSWAEQSTFTASSSAHPAEQRISIFRCRGRRYGLSHKFRGVQFSRRGRTRCEHSGPEPVLGLQTG